MKKLTPKLKALKRCLLVGKEEDQIGHMGRTINLQAVKEHFPPLERQALFLNLILQYMILDKMVSAASDGESNEVPKHRRRPIFTQKLRVSCLAFPLHPFSNFVVGVGTSARLGQAASPIQKKIPAGARPRQAGKLAQRHDPRTLLVAIAVQQHIEGKCLCLSCEC